MSSGPAIASSLRWAWPSCCCGPASERRPESSRRPSWRSGSAAPKNRLSTCCPRWSVSAMCANWPRRSQAARARDRYDALAGGQRGPNQQRARIGHPGGSGVAHQRDPLALGQPRQDLFRGAALVVAVQGDQAGPDPVALQQRRRHARIFGRDAIGIAEYPKCAQRNVGRVADRRGHYIQCARQLLLLQPGRGQQRLAGP